MPAETNAPPFPPVGVFSITGDRQVEICWYANQEEDLAGYAVYRNTEEAGYYTWIADVDANTTCYTDTDVNNGETWFYAVLAFDTGGLESELSYETVFDTPRPEGFGLVLNDYLGPISGLSGYDFSSVSNLAQPWNSTTTDIYFGTLTDPETARDVHYIFAASGVDIQDYGFVENQDVFDIYVDWAPDQGWSNLGRVEALDHHAYIVRMSNPTNYAKIWIKSVTNGQVTIDWGYQQVVGNPELTPGEGGASR